MSGHVFFCYARVNQDFAMRLAERLRERGINVWLDQWYNSPGVDWDKTIDSALRDCARLLILLSPESVDSLEVRGELRQAMDLGKPILPVLHKPCEIPRQLRLVQYVDFTNRRPDDEAALDQLVRTCTAEPPTPLEPRIPKKTRPSRGGLGSLGVRSKVLLSALVAILLAGSLWFVLDAWTADRRQLNDAGLSPDGRYLATASGQGLDVRGSVRVWEVSSGRNLRRIGIDGPVWVSKWSPDGKRLAIGDQTGNIGIYETGTWRQLSKLTGPQEYIQFVAWSPDSSAVATGNLTGTLWVWDVMNGALRFTRSNHSDKIHAAAWASDGLRLATASGDHSIAIVDAHDGSLLRRLESHSSSVTTVAFSPNGEWLASGSLEAPYLIVWDAKGQPRQLNEQRGPVELVAWSGDGRYLASASNDNTVQFWDGQRFSLVRRVSLRGHFNSGTSVAWSADGMQLAAGDNTGVMILNPQSDLPVHKLTERTKDAYESDEIAGWSTDGKHVGSFNRSDGTARVWDTTTEKILGTFRVGLFQSIMD